MAFKKETWPTGTIINENNGKKEIILPRATNLRDFSRKEKSQFKKTDRVAEKFGRLDNPGQSSVQKESVNVNDAWDNGKPGQKKVNMRQESINEDRRRERRSKDLGRWEYPRPEL
ncbi:MAG: hypothetical protein MUC28_03100 [Planctomycetes bacterium]|jgi:hypothetical protein|nr:hypothetical protein [Planctomycetota bacterium]